MISRVHSPLSLIMIAIMAISFVFASAHAGSMSSERTEHVVEITAFKFIPESLDVKAGDTVTWINNDIVPHTATADNQAFDTGELKQNESGSITFASDQTISYFCKFHPNMKGRIEMVSKTQ